MEAGSEACLMEEKAGEREDERIKEAVMGSWVLGKAGWGASRVGG